MSQIFKQTLRHMRQQPLLATLSVVGTALAICLIMIVMMTREVQLADYANEPNRSRTLYVKAYKLSNTQYTTYSQGLDAGMVSGVFARLKQPEAVALFTPWAMYLEAQLPGGDLYNLQTLAVNADYFKVYSLHFLEGRAFTQEECASNTPIALLSRKAARSIFGQDTGLRGRTFLLANREYRVAGVVDNVSTLLTVAHSDIWVPANWTNDNPHPLAASNLQPAYCSVALLLKDAGDAGRVRSEMAQVLRAYNQSIAPDTLSFGAQPDVHEAFVNRMWAATDPDLGSTHLELAIVFAILLIVPAINIASMTQSRLRQRREEIGVRRAFGARRASILWQTLAESFVQAILASALGLVLCFVLCWIAPNFIFQQGALTGELSEITLDARAFFSWTIYAWAAVFCVLLNVMSSLVPAWRACRTDIVRSLK